MKKTIIDGILELNKYSKDTILESKKFIDYVDLLKVVLEDNKKYSINEVNEILKNELNKEV